MNHYAKNSSIRTALRILALAISLETDTDNRETLISARMEILSWI